MAGQRVLHRGADALVGHMRDLDAGADLEQLHRQMEIAADSGRAIVDLAGRGLRRGDVVRQRLHRLRRMHHQHVRHRHHLRHRRQIAQHVIGQVLVDEVIDGDRAGAEQQRVAVGRRAHHRIDAERVARAAAVLDVELLAQDLAEVQREHARRRVGGAARRGRHQNLDRFCRPGRLRLRGGCGQEAGRQANQ